MSWSSGKDSSFALAAVRRDPTIDVVGLLVTMNGPADRVSMHAVRRELVVAQAERLGLPVHLVELPAPCPNERYEEAMRGAIAIARAAGVEEMVFGDLFLTDVRAYREQALAGTGVRPRFPLWKLPTESLAREMLASGIRAVITCVDPSQAPVEIAGRAWDERLLAELPKEIDLTRQYTSILVTWSNATGSCSATFVQRVETCPCNLRWVAAHGPRRSRSGTLSLSIRGADASQAAQHLIDAASADIAQARSMS